MPAPPEFIEYVDTNADSFIQRLKTAVEIPRSSSYKWDNYTLLMFNQCQR